MTGNAIELHSIQKTFSTFHLGPIDLTIPKGTIFGLIGPNAAGKTTTIDLIMGMGHCDAGAIRIFGMDPSEHEVEIKRRVGYVSPDINYALWKKVKRLIHFVKSFYPTWDDAYCERLMRTMNIGWNDKIAAMSFGTKVKLALIVALSHKPDLLLLDEPAIGVDAVSKQEIFSELLAAVQDEERTVLISSHGLTDIERFADRIGMIKNGRIIMDGATSDMVEPYRMIDFSIANGTVPEMKGLYLQEHIGQRCRALIDTRHEVMQRLAERGIQPMSESPVNLEELFVALTRSVEV